ncbi:MAG: YveK family protein [Eubacteriales bacterium]
MEKQVNKDDDTIDLRQLWTIFAKKWYIIIISGLLIGFCCGLVATLTYVPRYSSSVSFLLHSGDTLDGQVTVDDINRYAAMTDTYAVALIYNKEFCHTLNEKAGTSEIYTDNEVASMFSYTQILENTPTLQITVTSTDPVASYNIAMQFMLLANEELSKNFSIGTMDVFNKPEITNIPVNSDPFIKMMVIGFLLGAVLIYGIYVVRTLTDTAVHDESSLTDLTDCPILGVVPNFGGGSSGKSGSAGRRSVR